MQKKITHVCCPQCSHQIDVSEVLSRQLETELRREYDNRFTSERLHLQQQRKQLDSQLAEIQQQSQTLEQQVQSGVDAKVTALAEQIAQQERLKAQKETQASLVSLQQELDEKSQQVKQLHESRAEIARLQREQSTMKAQLLAENELALNERLKQEQARIAAQEASRAALQIKEREIVISQLNERLKDAQLKAEQGSMQLQGEAQELAVESWLRQHYPLDHISEIKKGALGADCLQTVNSASRAGCGTIYYESKRTRTFQPAWIEKFKADIRDKNANIGVIVSQARPAGHDRMTMIDGVWVCSFDEFKGLSIALRNQLIEIDRVTISQENQGDKMHQLYEFLQSNEFRLQVEGIVEGFSTLKTDLEKEKRAMKSQWKRREKQIDKVLLNTAPMYGAIKGIAGTTVQTVQALEMECDD